jgi:hypothetical protein
MLKSSAPGLVVRAYRVSEFDDLYVVMNVGCPSTHGKVCRSKCTA